MAEPAILYSITQNATNMPLITKPITKPSPTYNLSIIDFRQKPTHLFMGDDMIFSDMLDALDAVFSGWRQAFEGQSHKNKTILELHDLGWLGYQSFYLQSIGEVPENGLNKVVLSPKNDFKIGDFRVVILPKAIEPLMT